MRPLLPIFSTALLLCILAAGAAAVPPPESRVREVYAQVLVIADTDRDGTLSVDECVALLSKTAVAERNCRFWDADRNGIITADEYIERVQRVTSRKH